MKQLPTFLCLSLAFTPFLNAAETSNAAPVATPAVAPATPPVPVKDPVLEAKNKEQEALSADNKLQAERLLAATNAMRAEVTQLKLERELLTEKLALEATKRQATLQNELAGLEAEKEKLTEEGELSKAKAEKLASDLKTVQTQSSLEITKLQNEITRIETADKRANFANSEPVFLKKPLKENGTLVISDRRIPLNGLITATTADFITSRIQYWNNKDRQLPIFIVIDYSPGGSVMAGYRILKAMESSDAPVHVVVKSFAASMAAAITTLAKESYCYPNAVILHHQISSTIFGSLNLTQQRELREQSERWWTRFGNPIATKMGITPDDFIKKMYGHASTGDWSEFGEQAKELKWVDHVVSGIDETSFTKDPDTLEPSKASQAASLLESLDSTGKPCIFLPRLDPMDVYFLHNPDSYYRMR